MNSSTRDGNDPISDDFSARIDVGGAANQETDEIWMLNFRQVVPVVEGRYYEVTFKARASTELNITVQLLEDGGDFRFLGDQDIAVGSPTQLYRFGGTAPFTGEAQLLFGFGRTVRGSSTWLDDVSIIERLPGPDSAAVSVNFATADPVESLAGLLLGTFPNDPSRTPDSAWVEALQPEYWRTRWRTEWVDYVKSFDAIPIVLLSEEKYPENPTSPSNPQPWTDECECLGLPGTLWDY